MEKRNFYFKIAKFSLTQLAIHFLSCKKKYYQEVLSKIRKFIFKSLSVLLYVHGKLKKEELTYLEISEALSVTAFTWVQ